LDLGARDFLEGPQKIGAVPRGLLPETPGKKNQGRRGPAAQTPPEFEEVQERRPIRGEKSPGP